MPTKIEAELSPQEVHDFCARLAATPGGEKLRVIQALAQEHGVSISHDAAANFRDGPLADYLARMQGAARLAETVKLIGASGQGMGDAAAAILAERVFDRLLQAKGAPLTDDEAEQLSLIVGRLRTGDQQAAKLKADLALRDEQIAALTAARQERDAKKAQLLAQLAAAKQTKGGISKASLARIEQEAKLL